MAVTKQQLNVEFIRLTHPKDGHVLGLVGIDNGDHTYLTATLHPSVLTKGDGGKSVHLACYNAGSPAAIFENGYYVESNWLRHELTTPFSHTLGKRTITNAMFEAVAKMMVDAAESFKKTRKHGQRVGVASEAAVVLLEVTVEPVPHG